MHEPIDRRHPRVWESTFGRMPWIAAFALALFTIAATTAAGPAGAQDLDEDARPAEDQIARLYQAVFGRPADAGGFGFWNDQYRDGGSIEVIASQFAASPEFADRYGAAPTNSELVDAVYQNVLGRSGDAGGVAFWNSQLDTGAITQIDLLVAFADSPENIERSNTSQPLEPREAQMLRLYRAAFGRFPDASGFAFWMGEFTTSTPLRDIALRFSQSPEFTDLYGTAPRADELVDRLYQNVLGRSGDSGGVAFWEDEFHEGRSVPEMLVAFADSEENLERTGTAPNPAPVVAAPSSIRFWMLETMAPPAASCGGTPAGTAATSPPITTALADVTFVDLNADGATDAIVALDCGSGETTELFVWLAGGTPSTLDLHSAAVEVQSIDAVDTARSASDLDAGVARITWTATGATTCCPATEVKTEVTAVGDTVTIRDTFIDGPEVLAVRLMEAASNGGDRPVALQVGEQDWADAVEWLSGSSVMVDPAPCQRAQDDGTAVICLFATPGSPLGVSAIVEMDLEDDVWVVTRWEGLTHLS